MKTPALGATYRPYLPGSPPSEPSGQLPLARFLPPLPEGMAAALLQRDVPAGAWVIDPLGSTPLLALEAARAGYRVLVTSNNPVQSFMLELLAKAPPKSEFLAALAELAGVRRGEERVERHLQSLYQTECAACGQTIAAQAFLWRKDEAAPYARLYRCPHCGDEGEHPLTAKDLERLAIPGSSSLHLARALERVSLGGETTRAGIEDALNVYLPRPLYFLFTLTNKIEGLPTPTQRKQLLLALLLNALDAGNSLWSWPPGSRSRPRQLSSPAQFRENNLWQALEEAIPIWSNQPAPLPFTRWPELPPGEGGICLFQGRLKAFLPFLSQIHPAAAIAVLPRPNQAFWTLSALWSGWLWGREAAIPLKSAFERRRYDWQWHAAALFSALAALRQAVEPGFPLITILPELVPGFLSAAMTAAVTAGFGLKGIALRQEQALAQLSWLSEETSTTGLVDPPVNLICQEAIQACLEQRNQPAPYLLLYAACMSALVSSTNVAAGASIKLVADRLNKIQSGITSTFRDSGIVKRYEDHVQHAEGGLWWLAQPITSQALPLADQCEMEFVRYLEENPGFSQTELDQALCERFPGLLTPPIELLDLLLESYGQRTSAEEDRWQLHPREKPETRRKDLLAIEATLKSLGQRLGFTISEDTPLAWQEAGKTAYLFYTFASSIISRYVLSPPPIPARRCVLVLPGSRAKLLAYKLEKDPRLAEALESGWRILKFRHLRLIAGQPTLDRRRWEQSIDLDPPRWEDSGQMPMVNIP